MAPSYRAIAEPLLKVTNTFKAKEEEDLNSNKEEDLNSNKEVLGPLLDKNGNRRQAAKQERKDDKYSNKKPNGS